jgi:hypothetical protein
MPRAPLYPELRPGSSGSLAKSAWLLHLCLFLALLQIVSCSGEADGEDSFLPAEFEVRQALLSAPVVIDSAFVIQAPSGWADLDTAAFNIVREAVAGDTAAFFTLELLRVMSSPDGASCVISKFMHDPRVFDLLNESFEQRLKFTSQSDDVVRGTFSVNGVKVVQYRIITPEVIAFKLFCLIEDTYYEIDYLLPKNAYREEIRKVESSIGSIRSQTQGRR